MRERKWEYVTKERVSCVFDVTCWDCCSFYWLNRLVWIRCFAKNHSNCKSKLHSYWTFWNVALVPIRVLCSHVIWRTSVSFLFSDFFMSLRFECFLCCSLLCFLGFKMLFKTLLEISVTSPLPAAYTVHTDFLYFFFFCIIHNFFFPWYSLILHSLQMNSFP